jgi:hypothetical protein
MQSGLEDNMSRFSKFSLTALLALASIAPVASAQHVFVRGYFGPSYYGPAWGGPYGGYGYGYAYAPAPNVGKVKIETKNKNAAVFVDGGYAGTVGQLKTFRLRPGNHDIELRGPEGQTFFQERVAVIAGKTAKITPGY